MMKEQIWNDNWKVWEEENAFSLVWDIPQHAQSINLPHDGMIDKRPHMKSKNGCNTGFRDGSNLVYVKNFTAPHHWQDQSIYIKFEGVYMNSLVYLNGIQVANWPYGYSTFYADLSDALKIGQENELRVLVKNGNMPNSRWYTGTGIYRDVYLLIGGKNYILPTGLKITAEQNGEVRVVTQVAREGTVDVTIIDEQGNTVGMGTGTDCCLFVDSPALWSAEHPNLYKCRVSLNQGEDVVESLFGFRSLALEKNQGLLVNGEPIKLRGACIHGDNGLIGAAEYDGAAFRRIRILKEAGFNAIRMSHHPISQNLLRACDTLGMYVMDEGFDMWTRPKSDLDYALYFNDWWERDLEAMVHKCYNHPSVLMYSLGNEIPEIGSEQGSKLTKKMVDLIKSLDETRYTLVGINGAFAAGDQMKELMSDIARIPNGSVNDFMTVMGTKMDDIVKHSIISEKLEYTAGITDISGYNYMTARYELDLIEHPNRFIVGSETYPPQIARNWEIIARVPNVMGDFTWTGWDYIGEAGVGVCAYTFGEGGFGAKFPCQLAYCGDVDLTGFRRPLSYFREIVFGLRKEPYISVQNPNHYGKKLIKTPWIMSDSVASWNWASCEGKPVVIEVYSNADTVELFQSGTSLGQQIVKDNQALFETTYQPGTLRAKNFRNGMAAEEWVLQKAIGKVSVEVDIKNEKELIYADITLVGENGEVYRDKTLKFKLTVKGPAVLLGLGSADPKTEDFYPDEIGTTWNGRALAILKRLAEGEVTIEVSEV